MAETMMVWAVRNMLRLAAVGYGLSALAVPDYCSALGRRVPTALRAKVDPLLQLAYSVRSSPAVEIGNAD